MLKDDVMMGDEVRTPMFSTFAAAVDSLRILLRNKPPATITKAGGILTYHYPLVVAASWQEVQSTGLIDVLLDLATTIEVKAVRDSSVDLVTL